MYTEKQITNAAIDNLIRNIDLEESGMPHCVFSGQKIRKEGVLLLVAGAARAVQDVHLTLYKDEVHILASLPLSLRSFIVERSQNYQLLKSWEVGKNDWGEDEFFINLNVPIAKEFIKEVVGFILSNEESIMSQLLYSQNRDCDCVTVWNS